jgi:hypothetical protein
LQNRKGIEDERMVDGCVVEKKRGNVHGARHPTDSSFSNNKEGKGYMIKIPKQLQDLSLRRKVYNKGKGERS